MTLGALLTMLTPINIVGGIIFGGISTCFIEDS